MFARYRGFSSYTGQLDISGNEMTGILIPEKEPEESQEITEIKSEYSKNIESDINKYVIDTYIQGVKKHCLMKDYGRNVMIIKNCIDNECYKSVNRILNNGLEDLEKEVETIWKNIQNSINNDKNIEKEIEIVTERSKKAVEELLILITKQIIALIKDGNDNIKITNIINKYKYEIIKCLMIIYKG